MKTTIIIGLLIFLGVVSTPSDWIVEQLTIVETNQPVLRCANSTILNTKSCREMEEQILNTTVRILVETWMVEENEKGYIIEYSGGHATVKDGRYLVTHNHFSIPLSILERDGKTGDYSIVFLYDAQGRLVYEGPLTDFELFHLEDESMVFAHKDANFFSQLGFKSAEFQDWLSLPDLEGMEVAQIDWDGQTTRVDWTTVREVRMIGALRVLVLEDGALPGASGGGIFLDGYHVANNWRIEEQIDTAGELVYTITIGVLNTAPVAH